MKKFTGILIVTACLFSINVFADSSKLIKIDIDEKTTQIVRAGLGIDDFHYYIDTNACLCWLSRLIGGSPAVAIVDCAKLAVHPKLEPYVNKCVVKPIEVKKEEPISEVKKDEVVVDREKDKDKNKDKNKGKDKGKKDKDKKDIKEMRKESDKALENFKDDKGTNDTGTSDTGANDKGTNDKGTDNVK